MFWKESHNTNPTVVQPELKLSGLKALPPLSHHHLNAPSCRHEERRCMLSRRLFFGDLRYLEQGYHQGGFCYTLSFALRISRMSMGVKSPNLAHHAHCMVAHSSKQLGIPVQPHRRLHSRSQLLSYHCAACLRAILTLHTTVERQYASGKHVVVLFWNVGRSDERRGSGEAGCACEPALLQHAEPSQLTIISGRNTGHSHPQPGPWSPIRCEV
jgi:hypothetical protein